MTTKQKKMLKRYKKLKRLIRKWTELEIKARLAPIDFKGYGDAFAKHLDKEDEIRELLFKTDNLFKLGKRWKIKMMVTMNEVTAENKKKGIKKCKN